jgi:DEAD/DEAH box helicase domain-containing protein
MDSRILKQAFEEYEGQIEHVETIESREANRVECQRVLPDRLSSSFPYESLYSHQFESIKQLKSGENVCITTQTSSGKTMVFALYIAIQHLNDKSSTSLLVYPTKALSRDQKKELSNLYDSLNLDIDIGVYDGDTSREEKRRIRRSADIVITNFQGLNYYLPHHQKWSRIFNNLDTIVIDESHTYTGLEGIHVSWILRRLRRLVEERYSTSAQFILSSATIGNPKEHAERLTGVDISVVSTDGSPRGEREIVLWNPPSYNKDGDFTRKSSHYEMSKIMSTILSTGNQTLSFAPSRKMTELCSKWTESELSGSSDIKVKPYNAGHKREDRREVEKSLKGGTIDGVVSTTALELGVDIGSVDCTVLDGYPNRRASFWQQIGRSGRGKQDSVSVLVAANNSIDQYIIDNPEFLFEKDVENAVVDLDNMSVLSLHIQAAANEMPLQISDVLMFGTERFKLVVNKLRNSGKLEGNVEDDITYTGEDRPESEINLYGVGESKFDVKVDKGSGEFYLPPVEKSRAYRDLHPGAIYMYNGTEYRVVDFDSLEQLITLEFADVKYYTQSSKTVDIMDITSTDSKRISPNIIAHRGTGTIKEEYTDYKKIYRNPNIDDSFQKTDIHEPIKIDTEIFWIEIDNSCKIDVSSDGTLAGALHAAEHALIKMSPTVITVDADDLGGLSSPRHKLNDKPSIFIYDGVKDGAGFSHAIYDSIHSLSDVTKEMLNGCECSDYMGCPACTMSPMCGDGNEPMDTKGAIDLLERL